MPNHNNFDPATQAQQLQINISNTQRMHQPDQDEESSNPMMSSDRQGAQGESSGESDRLLTNMIAPRGNAPNAAAELNDEDFDFKGTSRKEYENLIWNGVMSEILENFLYLGSDNVARDQEAFQKAGITHVINCAADYSEPYFQDQGVVYLNYHLKDHVRESIECVFYDSIQFMEDARKQNGRVYVHCV